MKKFVRLCCMIFLMAVLVTPVFAADDKAADGETPDGMLLTTGADNETDSPDTSRIPFVLEAPKFVFADKVSREEGKQEINVAFSKNEGMMKYFSLSDADAKLTINGNGLYSMDVVAQIDWAIDDPNAWHADDSWDNDGKNAKGEKTVGQWAYVGIKPDGNRLQSVRIFPDFGNPKAKDNTVWNGTKTEKGWKDILTAEYLSEKDGSYYVDWNEHVLYVRVRYIVFTIDNDEDFGKNTFITDWSETAAVGKDVEEYSGYGMESELPIPVLSNPAVETPDEATGTVFTFDVSIDEEFEKNALHSEVYGGVGHLVYSVRLSEASGWKVVFRDAVSGKVTIPMTEILGEGETYTDGQPIEVYALAWIDQYDGIGGNWFGNLGGTHSNTLTYGVAVTPEPTPEITGEPTPTVTPSVEPTGSEANPGELKPTSETIPTETIKEDDKKVCPVCKLEFDPQLLGFCMFYWIGAAVVILIIIVIIVKHIEKKRDEETDILFR